MDLNPLPPACESTVLSLALYTGYVLIDANSVPEGDFLHISVILH